MSESSGSNELAKIIERLQSQRRELTKSMERIDATFAQYGISIGEDRPRRGRPKGSKSTKAAKGLTASKTTAGKRGRRKNRGTFGETAEQFISGLLKGGKTLTTKEINQAWKSAGRGASADNTLTKMTGAKQVKRSKLKEGRGSQYSLP